mmetsp:Transcript_68158/g.176873  ORF Transcript_68158/g.176873 Transcript_68158/m.176873 type:complete len:522 (-) Transcript_68158:330-1895(-)
MPLIVGGGASSGSASARPKKRAAAASASLAWHRHRGTNGTASDGSSNFEEDEEEITARCHLVQLVLTPILSLPGARAYHSSVLVDGTEYWFSEAGVNIGRRKDVIASHALCFEESEVIDLGLSARTGQEMVEALRPHFRRGTYDMLMKNCNAWTDCCIWFLLRRRLDTGFVMLDKIAAGCPSLSRLLLKGDYVRNPRAASFDIELLVKRVTELHGHLEEETAHYNSSGFGAASWFACLPACVQCDQSGGTIEKVIEPLPILLGIGGRSDSSTEHVSRQEDACVELRSRSMAPASHERDSQTSKFARVEELISASHAVKPDCVVKDWRHEEVPCCDAAAYRNACSQGLLLGNAGVSPAEHTGQDQTPFVDNAFAVTPHCKKELMLAAGASFPCDEAHLSDSARSALSRLAAKLSAHEVQAAACLDEQEVMSKASVVAAAATTVASLREATGGSEGEEGDEGEDEDEEELSTGTDESSLLSGSVDLDVRPESCRSSMANDERSQAAPASLYLERGASRRSLLV